VADALLAVAQKTRAIAVIDGPNTNDEAAIDYRSLFGSDRAYIVDPWFVVRDKDGSEKQEPPSARVAGLIAQSDEARGFWFSPSNQVVLGVLRTTRPISWAINDPDTQANYLNEFSVRPLSRTRHSPLGESYLCHGQPLGLPVGAAHRRHDQRVARQSASLGRGSQHHPDLRR